MSLHFDITNATIGVLSDTHGHLSESAVDVLRKVSLILHAGDIGRTRVLSILEMLAPTVAVKGNTDGDLWPYDPPLAETITLPEVCIYLVHDPDCPDNPPPQGEPDLIISGHTHEPRFCADEGTLYLNPGSAGPQRNRHRPSLAILQVRRKKMDVTFVELSG
jgi:hypothetical protein